ncbi:HEPN domain-containing protein [Pseudonocardia sp. K10HN5]|uniref:HEPN domain-containing protein n=1 Tax=Pseudonocardia acidicola TaxID=2724939 RepID=A0ABX1SML8_9PSEU|nr:HEPN domain-containing protein [Pseudonocardia acidicola]
MDRAREDLAAARLLDDNGFAAQAVSQAYQAARRAAEDALLLLGRTAAPSSAVVSAFVRHVVRERGIDPEAGRLLRSLFNRHRQVDHAYDVPPAEATSAIRDATGVVDIVGAWIDTSIRVMEERGSRPGHSPPHPSTKPVRRRC